MVFTVITVLNCPILTFLIGHSYVCIPDSGNIFLWQHLTDKELLCVYTHFISVLQLFVLIVWEWTNYIYYTNSNQTEKYLKIQARKVAEVYLCFDQTGTIPHMNISRSDDLRKLLVPSACTLRRRWVEVNVCSPPL